MLIRQYILPVTNHVRPGRSDGEVAPGDAITPFAYTPRPAKGFGNMRLFPRTHICDTGEWRPAVFEECPVSLYYTRSTLRPLADVRSSPCRSYIDGIPA